MPNSPLQVDYQTLDGAIVVAPKGELGYPEAPEFRTWLRKAHDAKPKRVVVDMSHVDYMSTPGVATLVEALQLARRSQTRLMLCGMNDRVSAIFRIARLDTVFEIVAGPLDQALAKP